jgi:TonB-dependent starch-binding outer membrane protein SusC
MKKIASIVVCLSLFGLYAAAQDIQVKGEVVSTEDGLVLPGVSIYVKGTTTGTTTDINGSYSINVPADATLVFSFVGMKTIEVPVNSQNSLDVTMESDATGLDEVIVVGYGTTTRASFVGSSSVVKSEEISVAPTSSFEKALQGNVTGLLASSSSGTPGSNTKIIIRGIGSITASTDPLYIVDGVPVASGNYAQRQATTNALASIDPADIENVYVLKDATATSIYGARASNGVVVIETKKGQQGKTVFDFNSQVGVASRVTDNFKVCSVDEYKELVYEQWVNSGVSKEAAYSKIKDMGDAETNWTNEIFRSGVDQKYSLSARGGTEKTSFYVSGNYRNQEGVVIASDFKRYSSRLNVEHTANDRIKFGLHSTVGYTSANGGSGGGYFSDPVTAAFFVPPVYPVYNEDGSYFQDIPENSNYNPVSSALLDQNKNDQKRYLGNAYTEIKIMKGLNYKINAGLDHFYLGEWTYWNPHTPSGEDYEGYSEFASLERNSWVVTNTLNYSKLIGNHSLNALVGQEAQKIYEFSTFTATSKFPSDKVSTMVNGAEPLTASSEDQGAALASFFGYVNYNYENKYYLTVSGRMDGSSRFGANNQWAGFGSVGGSWRISKENFLSGISLINEMKLRASYGTTGNQEILDEDGNPDYYPAIGLYEYGQDYNSTPGSGIKQLENPDLKWEKNTSMNFGLDFAILSNRLSGTVEYYIKKTDNLLLRVPISSTTGVTTIMQNVGSMENKGWEITLTSRNFDSDFKWITSVNLTANKNKITKLNNNEPIYDGDTRQRAQVGKPYRSFYLERWAGVNPADGSPMWYDADGNPVMDYSKAEKVLLDKTADPTLYGSFTNTFIYKGVSLNVRFYGVYGNSIFNNSDRYLSTDGSGTRNMDRRQLGRWQNPGDNTSVPKRVDGASWSNKNSTRHLEDGSYLRLKTVTLSYSIPKSIVERMKLAKLSVYLSADNYYTWTNFTGWDPEGNLDGTSWFAYPNAKTLSVGIDLSF